MSSPVFADVGDAIPGRSARSFADAVTLVGATFTIRSSKGGYQFEALCPAHDDHKASMGIRVSDGARPYKGKVHPEGNITVYCQVCRSERTVLLAVGWTREDLRPSPPRPPRVRPSVHDRLQALLSDPRHRTHWYTTDSGGLLYIIVRKLKGWWTLHVDDDGQWADGIETDARSLYHAPKLAADRWAQAWVTEGERDADTLMRFGMIATTVAFGSWARVDTSLLADREVNVVIDNDRRGWQRGQATCAAIMAAGGIVATVRAPLPEFKDVTAHVQAGHAISELRHVDLNTDQPPVEKWPTRADLSRPLPTPRPVCDPVTGRAWFTPVDPEVWLDLFRTRKVRPLGFVVWLLLRDRQATSSKALMDCDDVGAVLAIDRHTACDVIDELTHAGFVTHRSKRTAIRLTANRGTATKNAVLVPHGLFVHLIQHDPNTSPKKTTNWATAIVAWVAAETEAKDDPDHEMPDVAKIAKTIGVAQGRTVTRAMRLLGDGRVVMNPSFKHRGGAELVTLSQQVSMTFITHPDTPTPPPNDDLLSIDLLATGGNSRVSRRARGGNSRSTSTSQSPAEPTAEPALALKPSPTIDQIEADAIALIENAFGPTTTITTAERRAT